jgi:hypothetical protein
VTSTRISWPAASATTTSPAYTPAWLPPELAGTFEGSADTRIGTGAPAGATPAGMDAVNHAPPPEPAVTCGVQEAPWWVASRSCVAAGPPCTAASVSASALTRSRGAGGASTVMIAGTTCGGAPDSEGTTVTALSA